MKAPRRPPSRVTHIARIAVQDIRTSRVRARSAATADPLLRLVYYEILYACYEHGGWLSSDPEVLSDILMLPPDVIAERLPILERIGRDGRGGILIEGGFLANRRCLEDLEADRVYREQAAEFGKRGGRPKSQDVESKEDVGKGTLPGEKSTLAVDKGTLAKEKGALGVGEGYLKLPIPIPIPIPTDSVLNTRGGSAEGGLTPPGLSPPPEVVGPKKKRSRKPFPFNPLPPQLAALPWFKDRWEFRINELPASKLPTPAGEREQLDEALRLLLSHGEQALRDGVSMAVNSGWTGFRAKWCLDRRPSSRPFVEARTHPEGAAETVTIEGGKW